MARTQCISIIDESLGNQARNNYNSNPPPAPYPQSVSSSTQAIANDWTRFRDLYPDREFWLLQPGRSFPDLLRPASYINDPLTNTFTVNRDNGSVANRSDWFAICNLQNQPPGAYVAVWLDVSGSMVLNTVRASYDYFFERCDAAGINVVLTVSDAGERWSADHAVDFPPSVTISASPTSVQLGGTPSSSVLTWDVFGDFETASIDNGIGEVFGPGNITVSPTETTTYTLTATGPAGTSTAQVTVTVLVPDPPTIVFTGDPAAYINPGSSTLNWEVTGILISSVSINQDIGTVGVTGSTTVNPNTSTSYTLTATNPGGTSTAGFTLVVYQPVGVNITASPNPIAAGQTTTLSWSVSGDADTASIDNGIGTVLFNSSTQVSPSVTTTYTLSASGNGGADSDTVTVNVCQTPELSGSFPTQTNFGNDFTIPIEYRYASGGVEIEIEYQSAYGVLDTETRTLTGTDADDSGAAITTNFQSNIPWDTTGDDAGPAVITYTLRALQTTPCAGETVIGPFTVNVNIDLQADNINIPDSLDQIPSADPVESPDRDTVISDPIEITDIDINVEIKADKPIQVRFDNDDPDIESNWKSLRQIT